MARRRRRDCRAKASWREHRLWTRSVTEGTDAFWGVFQGAGASHTIVHLDGRTREDGLYRNLVRVRVRVRVRGLGHPKMVLWAPAEPTPADLEN